MPLNAQKIPLLLLRYRPWFIAVFQAWLVSCCLIFAWLLRFDFTLPDRGILFSLLPLLVLIRLLAMGYLGLFRGWWKYAGVTDAMDIVKAVAAGSLVFWLVVHYALHLLAFPRTIYVSEALLTTGALIGVRLLTRVLAQSMREDVSSCTRVLLIGAGAAAETILRDIRRPGSGYEAVGCLDDDSSKLGVRIHNVPVLGTVDQLPRILGSNPADEIMIAVPSATGAEMQRFVDLCNRAGVRFKTLPPLKERIAGQVAIQQLREVSLEDLLGRDPVKIDLESVRNQIAGRTILVTGAAGSIGSELCRQILSYDPQVLVCLDQSETGLFFLRLELDKLKRPTRSLFCVADITDAERIQRLLAEFKPQVLFHAAAYKHVPMMETNVQEAVKNNVLALLTLLELADAAGCGTFVLISSDKAVNPTNVMGATKRIGELVVSSRPPNGMRCVSVRFGNVLGSSGSVLCVLQKQLQKGEALTITHPESTRFFMTVNEAVALVLQSSTIGQHRDILVLDMGEPVRIVDLARSLIRVSGKPEFDIAISFTGLRPGEKLHEELFYAYEKIIPTSCEKIKRTVGPLRNWSELCFQLGQLRASMYIDGAAPVRARICEIVPECSFPQANPQHDETPHSDDSYLKKVV